MDGLASFARGMQALYNFSNFGSIITLIFAIFLFFRIKNSKKNYNLPFIILIIYYFFMCLYLYSELVNDGLAFATNLLWFFPLLISFVVYIFIRLNKNEGKTNYFIGIMCVLLIFISTVSPYFIQYWNYGDGKYVYEYDKKMRQGDYVGAAKIATEERFEGKLIELNRVYEKKLYEEGKYREAIDLYNAINFETDAERGVFKKIEYYKKSYKDLYDKYIEENKINDAIDLIYEINQSDDLYIDFTDYYDKKIYYDFNVNDVIKNLGLGKYVYFGTFSDAYYKDNEKRPMKWYYYKEDNDYIYLINSEILNYKPLDKENDDKKFSDTFLYKYLNSDFYENSFDDVEKMIIKEVSVPSDQDIDLINQNSFIKLKSIDRKDIWTSHNVVNGNGYILHFDYYGNYRDEMVLEEKPATTPYTVVPIISIDKKALYDKEYIEAYNNKKINFKKEIREKILKMKKVTEYPEESTVEDFDTIEIFSFGDKDVGKTEWVLLDIVDNKALLLSKYILFKWGFNGSYYYDKTSIKPINWENSTIKDIEIFSLFYNVVRVNFLEKDLIIKSKTNNKDCKRFGLDFGNDTEDDFFILSQEDIDKYFYNNKYEYSDKIQNNNKLKTVYKYSEFGELKEQKEGYWVRDKGYLWWYVSFVDENGNLNTRGLNAGVDMGVRLAVWIDIE